LHYTSSHIVVLWASALGTVVFSALSVFLLLSSRS